MVRVLSLGLAAMLLGPRLAAINLRTEASSAYLENIGRAATPANWRDALRHRAGVAAGEFREWRAGFLTAGELRAAFDHVPEFTRLNAVTVGLGGTIRQKFGFGAYAPAITLDLGLTHRDARIAGDDGWTADGALRVTKRLTESWRLGVVGDWQQHYARGSIWDTHGNGRLWGDFVSNAGPSVWPLALAGALGPEVQDYYRQTAWGVTHSLGPGWVSYRVSGRVSFWWLELSPALGRNTSLPLRYESLFSVNKVGIKYRQDIWTLQVLHRF